MRLGKYPEPTDLEKRILARGEARGRAEDVLAVLTARGLEVTEEVRRRVLAERDRQTLSEWLVRAVKVARAQDVFGGEG